MTAFIVAEEKAENYQLILQKLVQDEISPIVPIGLPLENQITIFMYVDFVFYDSSAKLNPYYFVFKELAKVLKKVDLTTDDSRIPKSIESIEATVNGEIIKYKLDEFIVGRGHNTLRKQIIMYFAKELVYPSINMTAIGKYFGSTHGTAINGVKTINKLMYDNQEFKDMITQIVESI